MIFVTKKFKLTKQKKMVFVLKKLKLKAAKNQFMSSESALGRGLNLILTWPVPFEGKQ